MDKERCKAFVFQKSYRSQPLKAGGLDIYQVGESEIAPGSGIGEHLQWCCEISYILSGEGVMYTGDTPVPVKQGDIHIISKNTRHTIKCSDGRNMRYAFLGFDFNGDFPSELSGICGLFERNPLTAAQDDGRIGQLFGLLISENYNQNLHSSLACELLMNYILILTRRLFEGTPDIKFTPEKSEDFIGQPLYGIVRYIDEHPLSCPSVSEICTMFSYSESYISHLFREKLGISIQRYIVDTRLKYAANLLREGKLSVSDVAQTLGYGSPQSFCKSFKASFGCTPGDYKRLADKDKKADKDTSYDNSVS